MTCAEAKTLLHALLDGELDAGHAHNVEVHVESCPHCAAELHGYREMQMAPIGGPAPLYGTDRLAPPH